MPTTNDSFSHLEEQFFLEGNRSEVAQPIETFTDLDDGYQRPSLWQRLFGKKSTSS